MGKKSQPWTNEMGLKPERHQASGKSRWLVWSPLQSCDFLQACYSRAAKGTLVSSEHPDACCR